MILNFLSRFISVIGVLTLFVILLVILKNCIHDFIDLIKEKSFDLNEINDESSIESFGDEL